MSKPHLTITTIGPHNSGKSTLCGRLLYELGGISERTMKKLTQQANGIGKESCAYAFYMDNTKLERVQGMTITNTIRELYTNAYHYTLMDAPGHKRFTKNMMKAVSQTDVVLLVIPADKDAFELSMQHLPTCQIMQQLLICYAFGIKQIIVCINKMAEKSVNYNEDRFNRVKSKLIQLLYSLNYDTDKIHFIPMDALKGINILQKSDSMQWYKGIPLIKYVDFMQLFI